MNEKELLLEGIRRGSAMILDNFGIYIKMDTLPTYDIVWACRIAYYGTGKLSRFWCRHVRPRLFPDIDTRLMIALVKAEKLHQKTYINAILEAGNERLKDYKYANFAEGKL